MTTDNGFFHAVRAQRIQRGRAERHRSMEVRLPSWRRISPLTTYTSASRHWTAGNDTMDGDFRMRARTARGGAAWPSGKCGRGRGGKCGVHRRSKYPGTVQRSRRAGSRSTVLRLTSRGSICSWRTVCAFTHFRRTGCSGGFRSRWTGMGPISVGAADAYSQSNSGRLSRSLKTWKRPHPLFAFGPKTERSCVRGFDWRDGIG